MVYDIANKASFERITDWLGELRKFGKPDVVILLVGNKLDLEEQRQVTLEEALAFADKNDLAFMETSAKTDVGVTMAFSSVVQGSALLLSWPIRRSLSDCHVGVHRRHMLQDPSYLACLLHRGVASAWLKCGDGSAGVVCPMLRTNFAFLFAPNWLP